MDKFINWLEVGPNNFIIYLLIAGFFAVFSLLIGLKGVENFKSEKLEGPNNSKNVGSVQVTSNDGTTTRHGVSAYDKKIVNKYGLQKSIHNDSPTDGFLIIPISLIFFIPLILRIASSIHMIQYLPLSFSLPIIVVSLYFIFLRRERYSSEAFTKSIVNSIVFLLSSITFVRVLGNIGDIESNYSLAKIFDNLSQGSPDNQKGWVGSSLVILFEFLSSGNSFYLVSFLLSIFSVLILGFLSYSLGVKMLGAVLIPATQNGKVYSINFLNLINKNFVLSSWWNYMFALVLIPVAYFLTIDSAIILVGDLNNFINSWMKGVLESV